MNQPPGGGTWSDAGTVLLKLAGLGFTAGGSPLGPMLRGVGGMIDTVGERRSQQKLAATLPEGSPERQLADLYAAQRQLTPPEYRGLLQLGRQNRAWPVVAGLGEPITETMTFERPGRSMTIGPESSPVPAPESVLFAPPPERLESRRVPSQPEGLDRLRAALVAAPDELTRAAIAELGTHYVRGLPRVPDVSQAARDAMEREALAPVLAKLPGVSPDRAEEVARAVTTGTTARAGLGQLLPRQPTESEQADKAFRKTLPPVEVMNAWTDVEWARTIRAANAAGATGAARSMEGEWRSRRMEQTAVESEGIRTSLVPALRNQLETIQGSVLAPHLTAPERDALAAEIDDLEESPTKDKAKVLKARIGGLTRLLSERSVRDRERRTLERRQDEIRTSAEQWRQKSYDLRQRGQLRGSISASDAAIRDMRTEQRMRKQMAEDPLATDLVRSGARQRFDELQGAIEEEEDYRADVRGRLGGEPPEGQDRLEVPARPKSGRKFQDLDEQIPNPNLKKPGAGVRG